MQPSPETLLRSKPRNGGNDSTVRSTSMLVDFLFKYRGALASFIIVVLALLASFSDPPKFSSGEIEIYPAESILKPGSDKFKEVFGTQKSIQLVVSFDDLQFDTTLASLHTLLARIESLPEITESFSILKFEDLFFLLNVQESSSTTKALSLVSSIPIASGLVSNDNLKTQLIAFYEPGVPFDVAKLDEAIDGALPGVRSIKVLSEEHIRSSIKRNVERDLILLSVAVCLVSIVAMLYFFSTWRALVVTALSLVLAGIPPLYLLYYFGIELNFITVLVFPLVFTLTLSDAAHLFCGMATFRNRDDPIEAAKHSIQLYWIPAGFTSLTTAAVLASFSFSGFHQLENLAVVSSLSVLVTYLIWFGLAPVLLPFVASSLQVPSYLLRTTHPHTQKRYFYASQCLFALIVIAAALLVPNLTIHSSTEIYIPRDGELLQDYKYVQRNFPEENGIEVMLKPDPNFSVDLSQNSALDSSFAAVHRTTKALEELPGVGSILSVAQDLDFSIQHSLPPEASSPLVYQSPLYKKPWHRIRITPEPSVDPEGLYHSVKNILEKQDGLQEWYLHAPSLLFREADSTLTQSLVRSLTWSSLILLAAFLILTRSIRATLAAVWVNLGTLSAIVIALVLTGQSLNTTTSLAAIVSLGIIVDDTVHVLYRMLYRREKGLKDLVPGLFVTSFILIVSFLCFTFSHFQPTRTFGLLTAGLLGLALIADVLFLPHYLTDRKRHLREQQT